MTLHNDLLRAHIPHNCRQCGKQCPRSMQTCVDFYPADSRKFLDYVITYLKCNTPRSKDEIMKRYFGADIQFKRYGFYDDGITSLDSYYVRMINDTLEQVRKGKTGYVYSIWQVQDILRYEPQVRIRYIEDAGAYEIKEEKICAN